jgi:hypothetical protein
MWVRGNEHASSERVLDAVLPALGSLPQRRFGWTSRVRRLGAAAVVAAAAVCAVLIGVNLPLGVDRVGDATATPPAVGSPVPPDVFPPAGELPAGRYAVSEEGVQFSFEVPSSGWTSNGTGRITTGPGGTSTSADVFFWSPDRGYADPCRHLLGARIGGSIGESAVALASVPGLEVTASSDVRVGAHPARRLVIKLPADLGCEPSQYFIWRDQSSIHDDGPRTPAAPGATITLWIVEPDPTGPSRLPPVVIDAEIDQGGSAELQRQIQRIVDSIRFE